ncbi:MAG: GNAT family N-acetyltransferase [Bacteroidales bacterium]|jgi:GNAT superfamily N-acetyltransferase|nr:GNAT family N-acetyltransferase [Bacteroidales bacterium]
MENKLIFRPLNECDRELFVRLRVEFLEEATEVKAEEKPQIAESLRSYFDEHIAKGDFVGMVAERGGEVLSAAYLIIVDYPSNPELIGGRYGILLNVWTQPEHRRQGISRMLLEKIIAEAKNMGVKRIDLMATEAGYPLYKQLGFHDNKDKNMRLLV